MIMARNWIIETKLNCYINIDYHNGLIGPSREIGSDFFDKKLEKICKFNKKHYLCIPFEKQPNGKFLERW